MATKATQPTIQPDTTDTILPPNDRAIRLSEVVRITGRSKSRIYVDMQAGRFPKGFSIGLRARAWSFQEVMGWLEARKSGASE